MDNKFRVFMAVLLVVFLTSIGAAFGGIFDGGDLTNQNILVCPVDDNGACNLAFLVTLENGAISGYTPVFTDGMAHPTATNDANEKLSFKDVFALSDKQQALDYAKEIYQANNDGVTVDAVATVDSQTINDVISAAGTLKDGENVIAPTATDILNADPNAGPDAVKPICDALLNAAKNPQQRDAMLQAIIGDYKSGDVSLSSVGFFKKFLASQALGGLFA